MKMLFVWGAAFLTLLFFGCTGSGTNSEYITNKGSEEFNYGYNVLYYYYYKASTELAEPDYYLEVNENVTGEDADIADVYLMYASMSDPMTRYYPSRYFERLSNALSQSSGEKSFGMEVDSATAKVKYVYREGPAKNAGIQKGDRLLSMNGLYFLDSSDSVSAEEAKSYNSNLYSTVFNYSTSDEFTFDILHNGDTTTVQMTREEVLRPTVYLDSIENIPVIRVTEFTGHTNGFSSDGSAEEFEEALASTDGAKSTVIDMRGNGGGDIDLCIRMSDDLLYQGDTSILFKQWGQESNGKRTVTGYYDTADKNGMGAGRYYVLMLDSNSASCTELFAAAITTNLKTPIVGTTSFGKGIGQYYFTTPGKAYAAVTAFLFMDKDGVNYHTHGFVPDYFIADKDSAMSKAIELAKVGTEKRTAGYSTDVQPFWSRSKQKKNPLSIEESLEEFLRARAVKKLEVTF